MTEQQRTLGGYKSGINEGKDFENPNEGKPPLNDSDEYIFKLVSEPKVKTMSQVKKDKNNQDYTIKVDKAICEFEQVGTGNIVPAFFRVDSLNFSDDDKFKSGVIKFFEKIKHPLVEDIAPDWSKYFVVGMRFRARVVVKKKSLADGTVVTNYYLDIPTCRPLLPSDKEGEDFDKTPSEVKPQTTVSDGTLTNALLLAKGATDFNSAMTLLKSAGASKEVTMALFQANLDGKLTFPI